MNERHLQIIEKRLAELANENQLLARQVFDLTKRLEDVERQIQCEPCYDAG